MLQRLAGMCGCGCGNAALPDKKGRPRMFAEGHDYRAGERKPRIEVSCQHCGQAFRVIASNATGRTFCSASCRDDFRRGRTGKNNPHYNRIERQCPICQSRFEVLPKTARLRASQGHDCYCSMECGRAGRRLKIIGRKREAKPGQSMSYWRGVIGKRDGYRCRICGFGLAIHVHHIIAKRRGGKNEDGNLITLCPNHHAMAHAGTTSEAELVAAIHAPLAFEPAVEPPPPIMYRNA